MTDNLEAARNYFDHVGMLSRQNAFRWILDMMVLAADESWHPEVEQRCRAIAADIHDVSVLEETLKARDAAAND